MINRWLLVYRGLAALIDYGLYLVVLLAYAAIFGAVQISLDGFYFFLGGWGNLFVAVLFWIIYFPVMESVFGYTLGKGLFDLKVEHEGKRVGFGTSFARHCFDVPDFVFGLLLSALPLIMPIQPRRLGDIVSGTTVVRDASTSKNAS